MGFGRLETALKHDDKRSVAAFTPAMPAAPSPEKGGRGSGYLSSELIEIKNRIKGRVVQDYDVSTSRGTPESRRSELIDTIRAAQAAEGVALTSQQVEDIQESIIDDVLGYGPLDQLLRRDDIADIMVNGPDQVFIEVGGKIELTNIRFENEDQLRNIITRIAQAVGRRIDESSPICDARLPEGSIAAGSRVNAVIPPITLKGSTLTIRKFRRDKLTLADLVQYGTISKQGADLIEILGRCRLNIVVSGGTGSGKTTLLNCITAFIDRGERIVTCEDTAELQLQQPHVVSLETRPNNAEGRGKIDMRDLVKNCLRMRPERIIVGEVRDAECLDLIQAMNTGHDGSMGTLHANSPREAINRAENLISMSGVQLSSQTIRRMIVDSVDVIIQVNRLNDGSRKITNIVDVVSMEGDVPTTSELLTFEQTGMSERGQIFGRHITEKLVKPSFLSKVQRFGLHDRLLDVIGREPY